jgi:hypothetical protein
MKWGKSNMLLSTYLLKEVCNAFAWWEFETQSLEKLQNPFTWSQVNNMALSYE